MLPGRVVFLMPREVDKPQLFREVHRYLEPEPALLALIMEWARRLPLSDLGILDLAAGYGIEALELNKDGFNCIAQEGSEYMVKNSVYDDIRLGLVEEIDFPKESFGGVLLKDAWVLQSPIQRESMLAGARDVLVGGGSLLVISERCDDHIATYLEDYDERNPQEVRKLEYGSFDAWKAAVTKLSSKPREEILITGIAYLSTALDMKLWADKYGFNTTILRKFDKTDELAQENRWIKKDGFVAELTKYEY